MPSFGLWWDAMRFHCRYGATLLPAAPLLYLPLFTDVLHSYLLKQQLEEGRMQLRAAASAAVRAVPSTLSLKIWNEVRGAVWSLIPLVFIVRVIEHRLCWGLASNVVAFEGLRGEDADARCLELARGGYTLGLRGLIAVPFLLMVAVVIAMNVIGELTHSRVAFWGAVVAVLWIAFPGSAAANTFYYLSLVEAERAGAVAAAAPAAAAPLF
jgi:hypothetical protein